MTENRAGHKSVDSDLPAPLTPAGCDLRSFSFMPLEIERLLKSKQWLIAKKRPELGFYAMNLWARSWREVPAASLEDDDDLLADAAMCDPDRWTQVRPEVLRGWVKCSDGRLYHTVVAELANEAMEMKRERTKRGKKGANARWGKEEEQGDAPPANSASNADEMPTHAEPMPTDGNRQDNDSDKTRPESVVVVDAGDAQSKPTQGDRVPGVVWDQRMLAIKAEFGAILDASPNANTIQRIRELCEPAGTGPPCDWEQDVRPAIEKVLGGYLDRREFVSSLGVIRKEAIRNRDRRLAGLPAPDLEKARERYQQSQRTAGSNGSSARNGQPPPGVVDVARELIEELRDARADVIDAEFEQRQSADLKRIGAS